MKPTPESPRMFQNDLMDFFSRSPWWIVPLVWIPIASYLIYLGPQDWRLSLIPVGIVMWTLTEYCLHRFLFHFEFSSKAGKYAHFLMHGVHHEWPNDRYRLVLPLGVSLLLALPFSAVYYALLGPILFYPFFGGYLLGYVGYDCTHYAVHHYKSKQSVFMRLKRHHLLHHHGKDGAATKFGVSSPFWDRVFRTL